MTSRGGASGPLALPPPSSSHPHPRQQRRPRRPAWEREYRAEVYDPTRGLAEVCVDDEPLACWQQHFATVHGYGAEAERMVRMQLALDLMLDVLDVWPADRVELWRSLAYLAALGLGETFLPRVSAALLIVPGRALLPYAESVAAAAVTSGLLRPERAHVPLAPWRSAMRRNVHPDTSDESER